MKYKYYNLKTKTWEEISKNYYNFLKQFPKLFGEFIKEE
jgi:hypothetical protein